MSEANTTASNEGSEKTFKASDLLKLAGLTYRQLSDWENRAGVLDSQRASEEGWRKFNLPEVYALCVCSDLRRRLGVPLDRLSSLYGWLIKPSALDGDAQSML